MADNYLENRMEAYRSGRLSRQSHSTPAMRRPPRPDSLTLVYPEFAVAVCAPGFSPLLCEVVAAFRSVGSQVSFCSPQESDEATLYAQRIGARYYPAAGHTRESMLADLDARHTVPACVIDLSDTSAVFSLPGQSGVPVPFQPSATSQAVARLLLFLAHPSNTNLLIPAL